MPNRDQRRRDGTFEYAQLDLAPASDEPALHPGIAFWAKHEGHDVGQRHEDGSLLSATCHDCGETYRRSDEPARCEHDFHAFLGNQRIGRSASPDGWRYGPCPAASGSDGPR